MLSLASYFYMILGGLIRDTIQSILPIVNYPVLPQPMLDGISWLSYQVSLWNQLFPIHETWGAFLWYLDFYFLFSAFKTSVWLFKKIRGAG